MNEEGTQMSRSLNRVRALLALTALSAAVGMGACSKSSEPNNDLGSLKVALAVQGGFTVNSVAYAVNASPGGAVVKSGTIDVSGVGANVSFALELPPGTDTITLTATSTSGVTFTGTSPVFTVVSGQTVGVSVTLTNTVTDSGTAPGQIDVTGTIVPGDHPPQITFVVVSPLQIAVGGTVNVSVTATDPDVGDVLSYAWTATPDGSFASATSATTTYSSSTVGTHTVIITVSDNHSPTALTASVSVPVQVISVTGAGGSTGVAGAPATGGTTGAAGALATGGTTGAAGAPATGGTTGAAGAPATGGTTGSGGSNGAAALQAAELATAFDPNLLTYTHSQDPDTGDQTPIGWGPSTLPSAAQQQASAALIRAIAAGLPGSVRNSTNTANAVPGTPSSPSANVPNPPNGLLTLGADPQSLISGGSIGTDAATTALLQAYANAAIADAAVPKDPNNPGGLTAAQAASNATLGAYIASEASDTSSAIGLAINIVVDAVQYGLEAQLQSF
jgi:hypothetical protein